MVVLCVISVCGIVATFGAIEVFPAFVRDPGILDNAEADVVILIGGLL